MDRFEKSMWISGLAALFVFILSLFIFSDWFFIFEIIPALFFGAIAFGVVFIPQYLSNEKIVSDEIKAEKAEKNKRIAEEEEVRKNYELSIAEERDIRAKRAQDFYAEEDRKTRLAFASAGEVLGNTKVVANLDAPLNKSSAGRPTAKWNIPKAQWNVLKPYKPRIRIFRSDESNSLIDDPQAIENTSLALAFEKEPKGMFVDEQVKPGATHNYYIILSVIQTVNHPVYYDEKGAEIENPVGNWGSAHSWRTKSRKIDRHKVLLRKRITARKYFGEIERMAYRESLMLAKAKYQKIESKYGMDHGLDDIDAMLDKLSDSVMVQRNFEQSIAESLKNLEQKGADPEELEEYEEAARQLLAERR